MHQADMHTLASLCAHHGMTDFVIAPGSRSAPLTLALVRHPQIRVKMIIDERSAGFIALGMALKSNKPVGLVCTSGTAALNFAPAVAEAFYQMVPLLVFTADRPPEWIDQQDGQTIRQQNLYGVHVKSFFQMPVEKEHPDAQWHFQRIVRESVMLTTMKPRGPVHINIPFREPLYPLRQESVHEVGFRTSRQGSTTTTLTDTEWEKAIHMVEKNPKILVVGGQQEYQPELLKALDELPGMVIAGDIISNLHPLDKVIRRADVMLMHQSESSRKKLQPDLLITFGQSIISKSLKLFLRKYPARVHCHIQPWGPVPDTYQSLTCHLAMEPAVFFSELTAKINSRSLAIGDPVFLEQWHTNSQKADRLVEEFSPSYNSEMEAVKATMAHLPDHCCLLMANSMAVRYANFIGLSPEKPNIRTFANRGTSGIDGTNGTAVGMALTTRRLVTLITGDLAFFYDRNAFWHSYPIKNLRIILLNNHGGGIFRLIDGPSEQPELETCFETPHNLNAYHTASEMGMQYYHCNDILNLDSVLEVFFRPEDKAKLLEIETESKLNKEVFVQFKKIIKKTYGT